MKKKNSAKKVMVEGQDAKELKELEYLHERLKKIWKDLFIELNEIRPITLDKLEEIMYYSSKKSELSFLRGYMSDITCEITLVKRGIYTINILDDPIKTLLKKIEKREEKIIANAQKDS